MSLAQNSALMEVFSTACLLAEAAGRLLTSTPPPTIPSPPSSGDHYSVPLMSLCPAHLIDNCPTPLHCSKPHAGVRPSPPYSLPNLPPPYLRTPSLFRASLSSTVDNIISQIGDLPTQASLPHADALPVVRPATLQVHLPDEGSIPVQSLQVAAAAPIEDVPLHDINLFPPHLAASPTSSLQFKSAPKNAIESTPFSIALPPSPWTPPKASPVLGTLLLASESEEWSSEDDASSVLSGPLEEEEAGEPAGGGEGAWPLAALLGTLTYTFDWPNLSLEEQVAAYTCFQASDPSLPPISTSLFESLKQVDPLPPSWALPAWTDLDA